MTLSIMTLINGILLKMRAQNLLYMTLSVITLWLKTKNISYDTGKHDTQHNDTLNNDILHKNLSCNNDTYISQDSDTFINNILHKNKSVAPCKWDTKRNDTLNNLMLVKMRAGNLVYTHSAFTRLMTYCIKIKVHRLARHSALNDFTKSLSHTHALSIMTPRITTLFIES